MLVHTESSTSGLLTSIRGLFFVKWLFLQYRPKHFPYCPYWRKNALNFEGNTCLWQGGGCKGGRQGSGGACCSLRLAMWQGTGCHHTFLLQQLPTHGRVPPREDPGPGKAVVLVQHDEQPEYFRVWRCGQGLLGVKRSVLHFELLYLKLCRVLDAYQVFTAVCGVSHFWRHFKVVSPVSDLLTLSRSGQDRFCFHCRSERTRERQGSLLHLVNPSRSLLKCVCKLFLWAASWNGEIPVQELLHSLPIQLRQMLKPLICPNSLPLALAEHRTH